MSLGLTFNDYQVAAHSNSMLHEFADPQAKLNSGFLEETTEVFYDIDDAVKFAYLFGFITDVNDKTKTDIAKEAGDALWYVTENITRAGRHLGEIAAGTVARHTPTTLAEPYSIADFDRLAAVYAPAYGVHNYKLSAHMRYDGRDEAFIAKHANPNLQTSTGYVLQRVFGRLRRKLTIGEEPSGPASNVDFESPELIEQSEEDFLWVVSGVAQAKLGLGLAGIAEANLTKLARRKAKGTLLEGIDPDRSGHQQ